ncbi:MAG TPA: mechanosensitive ion channel domain-containing protein [Terriglobia bacterium]|nr:mechanosensitive ion channel domain-containing protein [Terriglobia bacterium]
MKISGYRRSVVLLLCCTLTFVTFSFPAVAQKAPAEPKPLPEDPLGRSTPYGAVIGFLQAANRADYELASKYLEGKQSAKRKTELARDLHVVLNRGVKTGPDDLSKAPAGTLDDGLPANLEKVGTATFESESLDVVLRLTKTPDTQPIWLFSAETLLGVAAAASQLDLPWAEAIWPELLRDIRFLSYPLFMWLNALVGIPLLVGIAWPLTRGLLRLLHPLDLRHGGGVLAQVKWLLFLLVLSLLARIVATQAATAEGRIFVTSVANVFIVVAAGWLLVRLTKIVARLKTRHLRQIGLPGKIATVELFTWLLVSVWFTAGLFLILRSMGFDLTAVIAGLGIGGIAFAFAAQKTIENLFGTVTVVADEAIQVGDYCQVGTIEGRVENIGLRSTQIRTQDRVLVSVPNGQLAAMSIGNLARRDKFLFRHNVRLGIETTADQLRHVLAEIRKMMLEEAKLEPTTVSTRLIRFGGAYLELEAFAYVPTRDEGAFLELQEELLLRIMDVVEASGVRRVAA